MTMDAGEQGRSLFQPRSLSWVLKWLDIRSHLGGRDRPCIPLDLFLAGSSEQLRISVHEFEDSVVVRAANAAAH
jgi:hypothetical protein